MLRPTVEDLRRIAYGLGRVLFVVAISGLLPFLWAACHREWAPAGHFLFMSGLSMLLGIALLELAPRPRAGMSIGAMAWWSWLWHGSPYLQSARYRCG